MKSEFQPCLAMGIMLDNSKDIVLPELMSFTGQDAGKIRHGFIAWKGNKKKGKLAFNICPFCGQNIMNDKKQLCTDKIPFYDGGQ